MNRQEMIDLAKQIRSDEERPQVTPPPEQARQFNAMYIARAEDAYHHLASPLYAAQLDALPQTLVLTAELDSLAQEARQYANRLQETSVAVEHQEFAGQPHAFTHHGDANVALQAWQRIADFLRHVYQSAKRS